MISRRTVNFHLVEDKPTVVFDYLSKVNEMDDKKHFYTKIRDKQYR